MSRTKKLKDAKTLLAEILLLPLTERVMIKGEIKASIDNEVKEKQEAAKEAEQIANGK